MKLEAGYLLDQGSSKLKTGKKHFFIGKFHDFGTLIHMKI